MSWDAPAVKIPGLVAGADLSAAANLYKLVKLDTAGKVVLGAALTDKVIGSLYNTPGADEVAEVVAGGVAMVQADAQLNAGVPVASSADGQAASAGATDHIIGMLLEAPGAAGVVVPMLITHAGIS